MSLKKFEDFEHNLEENDKLEHMRDFKSAMNSLFPHKESETAFVVQGPFNSVKTEYPDVILLSKGTDTPFVAVKVLGFVESVDDLKKLL